MKKLKCYNSFYSKEPINYIPIHFPTHIPENKEIIGYKIYTHKYSFLFCFLPLCIKYRLYIYQEPIYDKEKFMK